ncbi:MAG TPA: hypothetical protein VGH98_14455 [Gemmatimonadaceae bacterium]
MSVSAVAFLALAPPSPLGTQPPTLSALASGQYAPLRLDRGRFTAVFYPGDDKLARALLQRALATDSFPGLPRPSQHVLIAIAPDERRFREWAGPGAPEWGAALAFPEMRRIVMQGRSAGSDAGNPLEVLRHELAHLALHEYLGDIAPRWFDEGYASFAARELSRNDVLAANVALALRGMPTFDELDAQFGEGATSAQAAYALAYRAVDDMASMDPERGLALLFQNWRQTGSLDRALRQSFGVTLASFEHDWQQRTRRRYGGLALFSDITVATILCLLLIGPLYIARRRRDRRRMAALVAADALAEASAARASVEFMDSSVEEPSAPDDRTEAGGPDDAPHGN